jgi:antitoxin HigA-1
VRKTKLKPIHPGEVLKTEFLEAENMNANQLAGATGLPASRIGEILRGRRGITAETAIALSGFFGNSAEFWMNMQSRYDLEVAHDAMEEAIKMKGILSSKSTKQTSKAKAAASKSRKPAQAKRA